MGYTLWKIAQSKQLIYPLKDGDFPQLCKRLPQGIYYIYTHHILIFIMMGNVQVGYHNIVGYPNIFTLSSYYHKWDKSFKPYISGNFHGYSIYIPYIYSYIIYILSSLSYPTTIHGSDPPQSVASLSVFRIVASAVETCATGPGPMVT